MYWKSGKFLYSWKDDNKIDITNKGSRITKCLVCGISHLDMVQSVYRPDENIAQCMLNFVMGLYSGFQKGENTDSAFVDVDGATFEALWADARDSFT